VSTRALLGRSADPAGVGGNGGGGSGGGRVGGLPGGVVTAITLLVTTDTVQRRVDPGYSGFGMGRLPLSVTAVVLLAGCPTLDLGDVPMDIGTCTPDRLYFETVIWPEYLAPTDTARSCVAMGNCHNQDIGASSSYRLRTAMPIDFDDNYMATTRKLNCGTPTNSPLLTNPLAGEEAHPVDIFPSTSDPAVVTFLNWPGL
jgi:hypothetical protein